MSKIICWWSGGITSAVACKIAIDLYGKENCEVIMIDTMNEHPDTYRFKDDCSKWYDLPIKMIKNPNYNSIQEVWEKYLSLNVAHGAVCSSELKRRTREMWQKENEYTHQVFGFEFDKKEFNRARALKINHGKSKPIFPLLMYGLDKKDCMKIIKDVGIKIPFAYITGLNNNNCLQTGCIQGGIGYWQKLRRDFPKQFHAMAKMEHDLTNKKGKPVTMLKDQSKRAKESGNFQVFLIKHPDYPNHNQLLDMKGREPEPLMECNGFCGTNDFEKPSETWSELNLEIS